MNEPPYPFYDSDGDSAAIEDAGAEGIEQEIRNPGHARLSMPAEERTNQVDIGPETAEVLVNWLRGFFRLQESVSDADVIAALTRLTEPPPDGEEIDVRDQVKQLRRVLPGVSEAKLELLLEQTARLVVVSSGAVGGDGNFAVRLAFTVGVVFGREV